MTAFGAQLPDVRTPPPGPRSRALAGRLSAVESRNVTWTGEGFPVFWEEARGANVRDADGNRYVDLTAAFGVALCGHGAPEVEAAVAAQAARLVHGMGDVHPPSVRVELLERLAALAPWPEARAVLASSGSEAVEIALKTALLATGRPGVLAFEGGYHGLTLGALAATHRPYFRDPFAERLHGGVAWAPWPDPRVEGSAERALESVEASFGAGAPGGQPIGAVILEPVQGRAGVRVPPPGFLEAVAERAMEAGALVVADEVFTGAGRAGGFLASPGLGLEPDLVCLGKALGGGLPLSACLGRRVVMDAWPPSPGEALHTSTFLGHPLACAAALAVLDLLEGGMQAKADALGGTLRRALGAALDGAPGVGEVRGRGLMLGVELADAAGRTARGAGARVAAEALAAGVIVLPAGESGEVVEVTPPAVLTDAQANDAAGRLADAVGRVFAGAAG